MRALVLVGIVVLLAGCGDEAEAPSQPLRAPATTAPAPEVETSFVREHGIRAVWIYLLEPLAEDPAEVVRAAAGETPWLRVALAENVDELESFPVILVSHIEGKEKLDLPDAEVLQYKARGFDEKDAERLAQSTAALRLESVAEGASIVKTLRAVDAVSLALTKSHGVVVEDEETREYFTAAAWEARMNRAWTGDRPNIEAHVVIHAIHRDGGPLRGVMLGMRKFGLPDLVLDEFVRSNFPPVGKLMNLTAQTMIDWPAPAIPSSLPLDLHAPSSAHLFARWKEQMHERATGKAQVRLETVEGEPGDPENRLLAIRFPRYPGKTALERQEACLGEFFGATDSVEYVKHNELVEAASRRAREHLLRELKPRYLKGLPVGESLLVKAPFKIAEGKNEWMWVEVTGWDGARIEGILMNDPFHIDGLKAGAKVVVEEATVFDYLHRKADGSQEGNTTAPLLR